MFDRDYRKTNHQQQQHSISFSDNFMTTTIGQIFSRRRRLPALPLLFALSLALSSSVAADLHDLAAAGTDVHRRQAIAARSCTIDKLLRSDSPPPVLFAPEADWPAGSDIAPAFTPDGKTVFFTHSDGANRMIMVSRLHDGDWSAPVVANFSGIWRDIEPAMAPDGSYLVFISNRPPVAGGAPLTGFWAGAYRPGAGGNIWRVDREGDDWGKPVRLPDIVNSHSAVYSPAVAGDGSIYFNQPDPVTRKSHLYRAQATPKGYEAPKALSISDGTIGDFDVAVAPDESFIVFSSNRVPATNQQALLFVSFSRGSHWTAPKALEPPVEGLEARFSPDLRTLYFSAEVGSATSDQPAAAPRVSRIFQLGIDGCARAARPALASTHRSH